MKIGGVQKTSFIDYPGKIAAVIFTCGCNFACGYCHNGGLFDLRTILPQKDVLEYLKNRHNKLDAVVISGGEPTLQPDLPDFARKVKNLGFLVKLDTNGTNPEVLKRLFEENLLDYVAMDIKAPPEKYFQVVNRSVNVKNIVDSVDFIKNCGVDYEFRTTVVKEQLNFDDFEKIGSFLRGASLYYLQKFRNSTTLNPEFASMNTYSDSEFEILKNMLEKYVSSVKII